ncbi:MAG: glycosyltransferase [Verrucomicrobiales bacterium]
MTFHRHFVERDDFSIFVAAPARPSKDPPPSRIDLLVDRPAPMARALRTRWYPWIAGLEALAGAAYLTRRLQSTARDFDPHAIFTVAGSWDWTALVAQRLARRLRRPLIASFNDWHDYGHLPVHPALHQRVERRFLRFYREADLALCTSEGMRDRLGPHPHAHVWYPSGALMREESAQFQARPADSAQPLRVLFAGSLGDWYGPMLEELVRTADASYPGLSFQIFGSLATWSPAFEQEARRRGIYGGHIPFPRLQEVALGADILLLPMGFHPNNAHIESTSFKTKFLDYLSFRRPILVWGPEYSSAVRVAREFDSAECVTDASPAACAAALSGLARSPARRDQLRARATAMYHDRFHPERIHQELVDTIRALVASP